METYKVQLFNRDTKTWSTESEHNSYKEAKKRCIKIVGEDYYSEPITETELVSPQKDGFSWNGLTYMNEKGETKDAYHKIVFEASEGYFGTKDKDEPWMCRISLIK